MKNTLLKGKNICRVFEQNGRKIPVLQNIDVSIYEGDFTIVMGASGAGKSTLLYALSGMDPITSGKVEYRDKELCCLSEKQMADLRAKEFGFVFQQVHLVSNLTLFENVLVAGSLDRSKSAGAIESAAATLMKQMHVEKAQDRFPAQVSGGEAQRAAIARAMIGSPGILFADEPTGALNRANTEEVLDILSALNENGQSVLMVTHDLRAAVRGNRLLYLEDGKILEELTLPVYRAEAAKEREEKISRWLAALAW